MFCKRDHGCSCALYSVYVQKMDSIAFKTRNYSEIKILLAKFIRQTNPQKTNNRYDKTWCFVFVFGKAEDFTLTLFGFLVYFLSCAFYSYIGDLPAHNQVSAFSKSRLKLL